MAPFFLNKKGAIWHCRFISHFWFSHTPWVTLHLHIARNYCRATYNLMPNSGKACLGNYLWLTFLKFWKSFLYIRVLPGSVIVYILCIYCVYIKYILCIHIYTIYTRYIHNIYTIINPEPNKLWSILKKERMHHLSKRLEKLE